MNIDLIYERVLMRLKEENDITEEDINRNEHSEEESLEEFSGVAALGGVPVTRLGTDAYGNVGSPQKWLKKNRTH